MAQCSLVWEVLELLPRPGPRSLPYRVSGNRVGKEAEHQTGGFQDTLASIFANGLISFWLGKQRAP